MIEPLRWYYYFFW